MAWRYLAQRVLSREWLDWDLPLRDVQVTHTLSGPPALSAKINPEMPSLRAVDGGPLLTEWATAVYAEADGILRFGGILTHSTYDETGEWSLEVAGFCAYANGIPYLGEYQKDNVDPLAVVREVWRYIQAQPDADLGVTVDATTSPVRLGKNPKHTILTTEGSSPTTAEGEEPEPYRLAWWEAKDCGDTIDELAKQTPFDYLEEHSWAGPTSDEVTHRLRLGYPRFGRKRDDLRFVLGENLAAVPAPEVAGDDYCNEVWAIGKGEGRDAIRTSVAQRDGRLRRVYLFTNSGVDNKKTLAALARRELQIRNPLLALAEVKVTDHPNARVGDWMVGDDIRLQGDLPWTGDLDLWVRITAATIEPASGEQAATLTVARSDSFTYGDIWQ